MAKYRKLTHTVYCCDYHIVFTPKYRFRILEGKVGEIVEYKLRQICAWYDVEIKEMNIQSDHIHMLISIPPKYSVSEMMGILKGKSAIAIFKTKRRLKQKPYWGNHFWARGYFVSTVGLDEEKIKRYIKYQEDQEKKEEGEQDQFKLF